MSTYHHGNLREVLLERAIKTIDQHGLEGMSLRQLAKDVGVSHAAPLRHFKSKADLLSEIVKLAYQELTIQVLTRAAPAPDPVTKMNWMVRGGISWALENKAKFLVVMNPDISRHADEQVLKLLDDFVMIASTAVAEAKKSGFAQDYTAEQYIWFALGSCMGVCHLGNDRIGSQVMGRFFGSLDNEELITAIANQIVPLPKEMSG